MSTTIGKRLGALLVLVLGSTAFYIVTKLLVEAWHFVLWCLINLIAHKYFFYDAQQSFDKATALTNQANGKLNKGVFSFLWGEMKNSTMSKAMEEDRKFRYFFPKAHRQNSAFMFFSTLIILLYSSSISVIAIYSTVVGLGYLMKPELYSLPIANKEKTDVLYLDYFAASGAIIIDGVEKHNYYIGIFHKWFLVPTKESENSQNTPPKPIDVVDPSKTHKKTMGPEEKTKNDSFITPKTIADRTFLRLK